MSLPTLFIVDDHDVARAGARSFLEDRYRVVGEADEVATAIEMIKERAPHVVLIDVHLPGGGGAAVVNAVRPSQPAIIWVAFTVSSSREDVERMLDVGVNGYLTKRVYGADLPDMLDQARSGARPISPDVAGYMLDIDESIGAPGPMSRLTNKEREVVTLIARGYTYREAASELSISTKTLETHMRHIFEKLGLASRHQVSALAYETGFVGTRRDLPSG